MYDSGLDFSNKGGEFAGQLIDLYTRNLGESSYLVISIAAFTTMFSTTITTLDASPRAMSKASQLIFNKKNKITPSSIKKNIEEILETTAEQDHVTVELSNAKELVGKDLDKHIKNLETKMDEFAAKLEFEDAARIRDEINRLKAKEVGISDKILNFKRK